MRFLVLVVLALLPSLAVAQTVQPVQLLHEFTTSPSGPSGSLLLVPDGSLYGVTSDAIYRVAPGGQVTIAARLAGGSGASGDLARGPDGMLYGTTEWGGDGGTGTVYRFDPATGDLRVLHAFAGAQAGRPRNGVTFAAGFLYVVTTTTLFRVDPSTGATVSLHVFTGVPTSPLTVGVDGLLYGTTQTALYRFDAQTYERTDVHVFSDLTSPHGRLLLGADGRLYGAAIGGSFGPIASGNGGIYRYEPATDTYEGLYSFGFGEYPNAPGPPVMTPDGRLYATTARERLFGDNFSTPMLFRLNPGAGGYTYEWLASLAPATGLSHRAALTLGADNLLYGYAQEGGVAGSGTVFRFDPAAAGPVPIDVLHAFVSTTTWAPSPPALAGDGLLYGTTSRGGAARRGAIYRLDPATGATAIAVDIPGAPTGANFAENTHLTAGPDGALYGMTAAALDQNRLEEGVLRVAPATLDVLNRPYAFDGVGTVRDSALARSSAGNLYFVHGRSVYRALPDGTIAIAGTEPLPAGVSHTHFISTASTAPIAGSDGHVYVGMVTTIGGAAPFEHYRTARVLRVNPAAAVLDVVADLGTAAIGSLAPAAGGLYVAVDGGVRAIDTATGAVTPVCASPLDLLSSMTPIGDRLVGVPRTGRHQLLVCHPATGAIEVRVLPARVGRLNGPLVAVGDLLYGATFESPFVSHTGNARPALHPAGGALIRFALSGTPPALDSEADGLSNLWETTYGLDPFNAAGDDGASGDPDGDGRTNAQELADGTHPRGVLTRYFAEGATGPFFRTRIDVGNPNTGRAATVLLRFLTDTGARVSHDLVVPPGGYAVVHPATIPGLAHATFSTVVEADATVAVERMMAWDGTGYGRHNETALVAPATSWYLAEGSTSGPFALFYLLQNPNPTAVTATVRYLRPSGQPPIDRSYALPPNSRTTIVVDDQGADLASTDVSAVITAPSPIVAERAMYYSQPAQPFAAGHESAGVTAPALDWFLAEGATGTFFDLFVLIANPNASAATVDIEYLLVGGGSLTKTYTVAANSRSTIWVDDEQVPAGSGLRPLANTAVSMVVRSTNGVPIVVERTMWWPGPSLTSAFWYEAHNSPGATTTATRWVVAGAEVGAASGTQTYVLIANPGPAAGRARVSTLTPIGHLDPGELVDLPPRSRTTVAFTPRPDLEGPFSVLVESVGTSPVPIVVEHATYSSPGGVTWAAGGSALATPLP